METFSLKLRGLLLHTEMAEKVTWPGGMRGSLPNPALSMMYLPLGKRRTEIFDVEFTHNSKTQQLLQGC